MEKKKKSRILVIGATGGLGFLIANASLEASHPTFALVRDSAFSHPDKSNKIQSLSNSGAFILKGSLQDEATLLEAVKQVDIVICTVPSKQALDQKLLISVIKQAGCIKRFIPSEFGSDPDKSQISGIDNNFYENKSVIRRFMETEGIPYTIISCNFFMSYLLPSLVQPGQKKPPTENITIFGDGNVKGVFMNKVDVAAFAIRAVDDPRTLNKVVYLRPPGNVCSLHDLVNLWEGKIGKKLQKIYLLEEDVLRKIKETTFADHSELLFIYSAFIKGDHTYFDIESSGGVDGTKIYPDFKYTTITEFLDTLL
ncbi:probable pinoresinol-lariciresinol reductase 3 [Impatiens glandulifera]|uniref:probable pinoresinol-lariciresinol reductase 3 n=1 Tax=Impatiens glandulifera TaxID=253017 RepID=UPI001FB16B22|nr:probable pinoresinol-lariciresinol reductase 3 [Impatiens glandulifera]